MHNLKENLQKHKVRFEEINACKDESLRKMRLEGLKTDMEVCYDIPTVGRLRIGAFQTSEDYKPVYDLYSEIKEAGGL